MASFDWINFFNQYGIEYQTTGPSVTKGNVAVHCPLCGPEDQSYHMGVSLTGKGWGCWRKSNHRGRDNAKLVRFLLGCSYAEASRIVGNNTITFSDTFESEMERMIKANSKEKREPLTLPKEFKKFTGLPSSRPYVRYLKRRGFKDRHIELLTTSYGLRYCTKGAYKGRIIFPVRYDGDLVTWSGRSIYKEATIRYLTLSYQYEKASSEGYSPAMGPITDYLLWYDKLMRTKSDTLYIVEGPFDAAKVTVLGRRLGICATCFFTKMPSRNQIELLHELLPRFKKKALLLDEGTLAEALSVKSELISLDLKLAILPQGFDDPGELSYEGLLKISA